MSNFKEKFKDFCRKSAAGLREAFTETPGRVIVALAALVSMLVMIALLITATVRMGRLGHGTREAMPELPTSPAFPDGDYDSRDYILQRDPAEDKMNPDEASPDDRSAVLDRWERTEMFPEPETDGHEYGKTEDAVEEPADAQDAGPMSLPQLYQEAFSGLRDVHSYEVPEVRQTLFGLAAVLTLLLIAAILALLTVVLLLKNCGSRSRVKVRRTLPPEGQVTFSTEDDPWYIMRSGGNVAVYGDRHFLRRVADLALKELGDGVRDRMHYFNPASPSESSPLTVFSGETVCSYRDAWITAKTLFDHLHPASGASERNEFFRQAGVSHAAEVIWNLARRDNAQHRESRDRICNLTGLAVTLSCPSCWEDHMMYFEAHRETGRRALRASHLQSLQSAGAYDQMAAELSDAPVVFSRFTDGSSGRMYLGTEPYPVGTLMLVDTGGGCEFETERPVIEAALCGIASQNHVPFTTADNAVLERMMAQKRISGWKHNCLWDLILANIHKWNERAKLQDAPDVTALAQAEFRSSIRKVDEDGLALVETPEWKRDADWRENSLVRDFPRYGYAGSRRVEPPAAMEVTARGDEEYYDEFDGHPIM